MNSAPSTCGGLAAMQEFVLRAEPVEENLETAVCVFVIFLCWGLFGLLCLNGLHSVTAVAGLYVFVGVGSVLHVSTSGWLLLTCNSCLTFILTVANYPSMMLTGSDLPDGTTFAITTVACIAHGTVVRSVVSHLLHTKKVAQAAQAFAETKQQSFVSYLMHEVRNPLAASLLLADEQNALLMKSSDRLKDFTRPLPEAQSMRLLEGVEESNALTSLIRAQIIQIGNVCNDVLQLEKLQSGDLQMDFESRRIETFVEKLVATGEALAREKHLSFSVDVNVNEALFLTDKEKEKDTADLHIPSGERQRLSAGGRSDLSQLTMTADCARLDQTVTNLVSNACKFTPSGGSVFLSIAVNPADQPASVGGSTSAEGTDLGGSDGSLPPPQWASVCVTVRDTGVGIEKEKFEKMFHAYRLIRAGQFQNSAGSGLGLSINRLIMEAHPGGRLSASSEGLGMGSEFKVEFVTPVGLSETPLTVFQTRRELLERRRMHTHAARRSSDSALVVRCHPAVSPWCINDSAPMHGMLTTMEAPNAGRGNPRRTEFSLSAQLNSPLDATNRSLPPFNFSTEGTHRGMDVSLWCNPEEKEKEALDETETISTSCISPHSDGTCTQHPHPSSPPTRHIVTLIDSDTESESLSSSPIGEGGEEPFTVTADVLVVDDNQIVQSAVAMSLKRMGLSIEVCGDGTEAVSRIVDRGERYHLVLMDRNMPKMEGPEAISAILSHFRNTRDQKEREKETDNRRCKTEEQTERADQPPIILGLTGQTEGATDFLTAGAESVLFKPVTYEGLRKAIQTANEEGRTLHQLTEKHKA
uniref:histidine kinase n=1 Tax=Chromera velia CCMP2878 TaxID=1169474 RepID=A0A0G4GL79_9ALVE|eukprot:Cvel_4858.t1-p1 / transcript=Cvel_4858.t1 / gene=Cvel_4858 / organism=Chromera_velia_CCMP2878 / gene_product=Sensor histidine kinase ResE, putative / transcript_product=Sensor histidine kinase ResE, putative / location=Cvel_scaffold219:35049-38911(+) / protein_length=809 / sequence_SO=supercontig / SO=protein_coding / is_pseudo=false